MFDLDNIFVAHEHAVVLSYRVSDDQWSVGPTYSSTNYCNNIAAISKSELVIDPFGFLSLTTSLLT